MIYDIIQFNIFDSFKKYFYLIRNLDDIVFLCCGIITCIIYYIYANLIGEPELMIVMIVVMLLVGSFFLKVKTKYY